MKNEILRAKVVNNTGIAVVSMRCPACGQQGTFDPIGQDLALFDGKTAVPHTVGHRVCPNTDCKAHVFVHYVGKEIVESYPAERIDFDSTNIPDRVLRPFAEAIGCHANQFYTASAVMVRKTLEELCHDRGAAGDNLKKKLSELRNKVVLPQELLDGLDDIRLLGNDAAHLESQFFDKVDKEEVEIGIEFTKEVLKAVYQYSALLNKIRGFKKSSAAPAGSTKP